MQIVWLIEHSVAAAIRSEDELKVKCLFLIRRNFFCLPLAVPTGIWAISVFIENSQFDPVPSLLLSYHISECMLVYACAKANSICIGT